jgi:hypothetical protein
LRRTIAAGAVIIASMAAAAPAHALRYASPTGSAIADCQSVGNACTLTAAVEGNVAGAPSADEEVIVLPGSYTLTGELIPASAGLNIHGAFDQPRPVINATARFTLNSGSLSYLQIEAATIGEAINSSNATLDRLLIRGTNNSDTPLCQCYGGSFRNSVVVSTGTAPAVGMTSNGGSFTVTYRNVTAYTATSATPAVQVEQVAAGALELTLINSVALNGAGGSEVLAVGADSTITFDHSNYRNASTVNSGVVQDAPGSPHQTTLPTFANAAGGDFTQLAGSPTIDAGLSDPLTGTTDFAGGPRTIGASTDIGADEYEPPPPGPGSSTSTKKKCKKKKKKGKKRALSVPGAKKKKKKGCKKKRKKKRG